MRLFRSKATPEDRKGSVDSNIYSTISHSSQGSRRESEVSNEADQPSRRKSSLGGLFRRKHHSVDIPREKLVTRTKFGSVGGTPVSTQSTKLKKQNYPAVDLNSAYKRDKQTGEQVIDHTDLLHSLVHQESSDSVPRVSQFRHGASSTTLTGDELLAKLPTRLWLSVFEQLSPADKASLSLTCKALRQHLITCEVELELPENDDERTNFLLRLDSSLPNHLFCFACKIYHRRLNPRKESLKPTNVANPLFNCPHAQNLEKRISRVRITSGRTLPFTFIQLAMRANNFSTDHGIDIDNLSKRWRDREQQWNHQSRYAVIEGHLMVRIVSTTFAGAGLPPAGIRNILYNPHEEFHPYFSTCPHWRDGLLMPTVKCALSHIPKPVEGGGINRLARDMEARLAAAKSPIISLCSECRPMRRCPSCPTEYLIEIKLAEDRNEQDPTKIFKQALVVTRWSDLGDGSSPMGSREWAACSGALQDFDSFTVLGKRAISGVFESFFNAEQIPGQRMLSMNPNQQKLGEDGHDWY